MVSSLIDYWQTELMDIRNFKNKIGKNVDEKLGWTDKMKSTWITSLLKIVQHNRAITNDILIKTSAIADDTVTIAKSIAQSSIFENINQTTVSDMRRIIKFASVFKIPLDKTFLKAEFKEGIPDIKSYHELLLKSEECFARLDDGQLKKFDKIMKNITKTMKKYERNIRLFSNQFNNRAFREFVISTSRIGFHLNRIDKLTQVADFKPCKVVTNSVHMIHASIEECMKYINSPHPELKSNLRKLADEMANAHLTQMNLPTALVSVFRQAPKPKAKLTIFNLPSQLVSKARNIANQSHNFKKLVSPLLNSTFLFKFL